MMNCIYCNNPIIGRKKGDHIIPQGLGKFSPDLRVLHACKKCDSENGDGFERIVLRTGILSVFRSTMGIKSRNNKRGPIHSPSLDKFSAIESREFAITNTVNPDETIYVGVNGSMRYVNFILIKKKGLLIDRIEIPPTRNIGEICNFIESKIPKKLDDLECELSICKEQMEEVKKELSRRGTKLEDAYLTGQDPVFSKLMISFILTENHFRFIANTVLKGMILLGYKTDLLRHMIEYVKTGNSNNLIYKNVDQQESGADMEDGPPLNVFFHEFEWRVTENSIVIAASILAHKNVNGIRMKLSLKAGNDDSIIIPYGKIIAKYGDTPSDGTLEIFHGDHKIEIVNGREE